VLNQLWTLARLRGQAERAAEYLRESLTLGRTLERAGDRGHLIGRALIQLGRALSEQGDFTAAMAVFRDALSGGAVILMGQRRASCSIGPQQCLAQPARRCVRHACSAPPIRCGLRVAPNGSRSMTWRTNVTYVMSRRNSTMKRSWQQWHRDAR